MANHYDDKDDENEELHTKLQAPPDFRGPTEERYCTDVLCLFLLGMSWIVLTVLGFYAIRNGDYRYLIYPLDYQGNVCGTDLFEEHDMTEYPYLLYINVYGGGVCVQECPQLLLDDENDDTFPVDTSTLITYAGLYSSTTNSSSKVKVSPVYEQMANTTVDFEYQCTPQTCGDLSTGDNDGGQGNINGTTTSIPSIASSWTSRGINQGYGYAYYVADTYEVLQRCYLTEEAQDAMDKLVQQAENENGGNVINDIQNNATDALEVWKDATANLTQDFFSALFQDLWTARYYIVGFGFGASLVISLLYMALLRIPCLLTTVVWSSVATVIAMFSFAGYYAYSTATDWQAMDKPPVRADQIDYTFYASYVCFGIAAALVLAAICLRASIQVAITCVQHGGAAIHAMVVLLLVPLLQALGFLAFWVVWSYFAVHLASMGSITTQTYDIPTSSSNIDLTIRSYDYDDFTRYCGWYMLFCFFWTATFIVALGDMMVAMAVSTWYFTVQPRNVSSCTVFKSFWTVLRYHLGTCAYGSLLIAIVQLLRAIITRFQKKAGQMTNKSLAKCMFCCCQCCLCCLERCLQFINKNAYVQCAIFGTPFCESGRKAFFLILRNAGRVGAVSYVSGMVLLIGKLLISTVTTTFAYYFMVEYIELSLNSFAGPVVTVFILSYFISDMSLGVFDLSILTVLHCFVADEEMFGGRARYADGSLNDWIDKNAELESDARTSAITSSKY